jgi:hypothetical protein
MPPIEGAIDGIEGRPFLGHKTLLRLAHRIGYTLFGRGVVGRHGVVQPCCRYPQFRCQGTQRVCFLSADEEGGQHVQHLEQGGLASELAHRFPVGIVVDDQVGLSPTGRDVSSLCSAIQVLAADSLAFLVDQHPLHQSVRRYVKAPGCDSIQARCGSSHTRTQLDTASIVAWRTQGQAAEIIRSMRSHHFPVKDESPGSQYDALACFCAKGLGMSAHDPLQGGRDHLADRWGIGSGLGIEPGKAAVNGRPGRFGRN